MRFDSLLAAAVLAAASAACDSDGGNNMMSPDANSFQPIDVNAALGPELPADEANMTGNSAEAVAEDQDGETTE